MRSTLAMRYQVTIDGVSREVDVSLTPGSSDVVVSIDGEAVDADIQSIPGGLHIKAGNRIFDVIVGGSGETVDVAKGGVRARAEVISERAKARTKRKGGGSSSKEVRAPMPGRVVSVLVSVGDEVEEGAPVVVIEAMKMENELRASAAGKVAAIEVSPEQSVEGGALLVRFE